MEKEQMRVRILKSVVKSKFNELDGTFLSVLGAYIKQAEMKDDMPLLSLCKRLRRRRCKWSRLRCNRRCRWYN